MPRSARGRGGSPGVVIAIGAAVLLALLLALGLSRAMPSGCRRYLSALYHAH